MKNIFNKTNAPYLVAGALATLTLLASGVFAVAPYVGFLAPVPDVIKLPYKDTKLLSKEGVDLDYLDLAVPSSKQEKRANSLDYLDLATSKNLNDLDVKISSLKNQLAEKKRN